MAVLEATGGTTARLLHAATGEQIVVVELPARRRPRPRRLDPATLPLPDGLDAGIGWGLYRLDFTATPDS